MPLGKHKSDQLSLADKIFYIGILTVALNPPNFP